MTRKIPSSPPAWRSASASSSRSKRSTKLGTSTAERAPAAKSSNTTVGRVLEASNVLPRKLVPSTAATTMTRAPPRARETAAAAPMPAAARPTERGAGASTGSAGGSG